MALTIASQMVSEATRPNLRQMLIRLMGLGRDFVGSAERFFQLSSTVADVARPDAARFFNSLKFR